MYHSKIPITLHVYLYISEVFSFGDNLNIIVSLAESIFRNHATIKYNASVTLCTEKFISSRRVYSIPVGSLKETFWRSLEGISFVITVVNYRLQ